MVGAGSLTVRNAMVGTGSVGMALAVVPRCGGCCGSDVVARLGHNAGGGAQCGGCHRSNAMARVDIGV